MASKMAKKELKRLNSKYQRICDNVSFEAILDTTLIIVGVGASSFMIEDFARMGVKKFFLFDFDQVEQKNLTCQNFEYSDIGKQKPVALSQRLQNCEFESGNKKISPLKINNFGSFLDISDEVLDKIIIQEKELGNNPILIMATDYHPAQARGNRVGIRHNVLTFFVGVYKAGKAGEIIFTVPDSRLPCYRCIAETRYNFFDTMHMERHLQGDCSKSGVSSGLPFAITFIDSILGHLIIGGIHRNIPDNPHGKLFNKLVKENRNFIQCQLAHDYLLNGTEDIFEQIKGEDIVTFNTIFQKEPLNNDCHDCGHTCHGCPPWDHTDYTKSMAKISLDKT